MVNRLPVKSLKNIRSLVWFEIKETIKAKVTGDAPLTLWTEFARVATSFIGPVDPFDLSHTDHMDICMNI